MKPNLTPLLLIVGLAWTAGVQAAGAVYQNTGNADQIELTNIKDPDRNDLVVATDSAVAVRTDALARTPGLGVEPLPSASRAVDAGVEPQVKEASAASAEAQDEKTSEHRRGIDELATARNANGSIDLNPDGRSELGANTRSALQLGVTSSPAVSSASSFSSEVPQASDAQLENYKNLMIQKASANTYYITGNPAESRKYLKVGKAAYTNGG